MIFNLFFHQQNSFIMNNFEIKDALTVVELEGRFETTVAAVDTARCDGNSAEVKATDSPSLT